MMSAIKKLQYVTQRHEISVFTIAAALSAITRANAEELFLKAYNYAILEPRTAGKAVGRRLYVNSYSHALEREDFSRKMAAKIPGALPISDCDWQDAYLKACKLDTVWTKYLHNPKGYFMLFMRALLKGSVPTYTPHPDCWKVLSALTTSHELAVNGGVQVNLSKLLEALDVAEKPTCERHRESAAVATLLAELVAGSMYAYAEASQNVKVRERVVHFFEEYPKLQKKLDKDTAMALHKEILLIDIFTHSGPVGTDSTQPSKPADPLPEAQETIAQPAVAVSEAASDATVAKVSESPDVVSGAEGAAKSSSEVVLKPKVEPEVSDVFEINKEMLQGVTEGVLVQVKVTLKVKPSALCIKDVDAFKKQVTEAGYSMYKAYQDAESALHRKLKSVYEEVEDKRALQELEAAVEGLSPRALALYRQLTQK